MFQFGTVRHDDFFKAEMQLPHGARGSVTESLRFVPPRKFDQSAIHNACNTLVHNEL
jgi:hypothetical protein